LKKAMFCPSCGSDKGPFFKGLCRECFTSQSKLLSVSDKINAEHCDQCNRIKVSGKWMEQSEKNVLALLEKKIKVKDLQNPKLSIELKPVDGKTLAIVTAKGLLDNSPVELQAKTLLVPDEVQCNDCMLLKSNYFEATLQLRFQQAPIGNEMEKVLEKIEKILVSSRGQDSIAHIVGVSKNKNGLDVKIASNKAAKIVVKQLSKNAIEKVKTTSSLVGRTPQGKEKKRFTYCLRF